METTVPTLPIAAHTRVDRCAINSPRASSEIVEIKTRADLTLVIYGSTKSSLDKTRVHYLFEQINRHYRLRSIADEDRYKLLSALAKSCKSYKNRAAIKKFIHDLKHKTLNDALKMDSKRKLSLHQSPRSPQQSPKHASSDDVIETTQSSGMSYSLHFKEKQSDLSLKKESPNDSSSVNNQIIPPLNMNALNVSSAQNLEGSHPPPPSQTLQVHAAPLSPDTPNTPPVQNAPITPDGSSPDGSATPPRLNKTYRRRIRGHPAQSASGRSNTHSHLQRAHPLVVKTIASAIPQIHINDSDDVNAASSHASESRYIGKKRVENRLLSMQYERLDRNLTENIRELVRLTILEMIEHEEI